MRKINSFMKVLGACKQSGVGSHVKYSFSIGEVNHSYTIANSVVKSDSFYASMLLQDIAVLNSEPRLVDPVFMEILKLAFSKIGVGLKLKD